MAVANGGSRNHSFLLDMLPAGCCANLTATDFLTEFSMNLGDVDYEDLLEGLDLTEAAAGYQADADSTARRVVGFIEVYVVPAVALAGMLGNLLSFVVFVGTYLRAQSSSVYLAALSVANLGFLLTVFVSKLGLSGLDLYKQNGWCQFFSYVTYVTSFLSMWYVVAFTVERYIATHFPFRRRTCTCRRAVVVVTGLFLLAMGLYSFGIFTSGVTVIMGFPMCGPTPRHYKFVSIVYHVDTVITLILPFVTILVLNVRIGSKVILFYRRLSRQNGAETASCGVSKVRSPRGSPGRHLRVCISANAQQGFSHSQWRVTRMLLVVSTTFLLLNLPRHASRIYTFIMTLSDHNFIPPSKFVLAQKLFQLLYYLHFSVNIFLYSGTEATFRKAMCWLFRKVRSGITEHLSKLSNLPLHCSSSCRIRRNCHEQSSYDTTSSEISLRRYDRREVVSQV